MHGPNPIPCNNSIPSAPSDPRLCLNGSYVFSRASASLLMSALVSQDSTRRKQPFEVPEGGLASFLALPFAASELRSYLLLAVSPRLSRPAYCLGAQADVHWAISVLVDMDMLSVSGRRQPNACGARVIQTLHSASGDYHRIHDAAYDICDWGDQERHGYQSRPPIHRSAHVMLFAMNNI